MKFIPYERLTISTALNRSKVIELLRAHTEEKKLFRSPFRETGWIYFEGEVQEFSFAVELIGKSSCVLEGTVNESKEGTIIVLKIRLKIYVMVLQALIFFGLLMACISDVATLLDKSTSYHGPVAAPFIGLLLIYGIVMLIFGPESTNLKDLIFKLLKAKFHPH